jgi:hypothetical protein
LVSTGRFSSINIGIISGTAAALFYAAGYGQHAMASMPDSRQLI